MTDRSRILFVEDDDSLRRVAEYNLHRAGFAVAVASDGAEGWAAFQKDGADLVVTDLAMQKLDGYELLRRVKGVSPDTEVIIITAYGTVDRAVEAMKAGAFDFVTKPFEFDVLRLTIERALERRRLLQENTRLQSELTERFRPESIIGVSSGMERIFDLIRRVAPTDTNVLILGESGTGKELIARAIHHHGHRKNGPFVAVNCGALPRDLIESELFGAQRGAFTGADHDRPGRFERATGGTLFLDEITELPTDLQVKLLRALQERQIERLGGQEPIAVDVRFICASNADVGQLVATGAFRRDLYFRINVVTIQVPPLRQRTDDIEPLARAFLERYHADKVVLEPEALAALKRHAWPGNVRELENAIERAVVLRQNPERITVADLPWEITAPVEAGVTATGSATASANLPDGGIDFSSVEKSLLEQALRKAGGNRSRAARLLGMSRQTLLYRLKKFGISVE